MTENDQCAHGCAHGCAHDQCAHLNKLLHKEEIEESFFSPSV